MVADLVEVAVVDLVEVLVIHHLEGLELLLLKLDNELRTWQNLSFLLHS